MSGFISCSVCGCLRPLEPDGSVPPGWTSGHDVICSVECFRTLYAGRAVAHLFPAYATEEEHVDLRRHEQSLIDAVRSARTPNPTLLGTMAGSVFKAREERERARRRSP